MLEGTDSSRSVGSLSFLAPKSPPKCGRCVELPGFLFAAQVMSAKLFLAGEQQSALFYPSSSGLIKFYSFKPHAQLPGKSKFPSVNVLKQLKNTCSWGLKFT